MTAVTTVFTAAISVQEEQQTNAASIAAATTETLPAQHAALIKKAYHEYREVLAQQK